MNHPLPRPLLAAFLLCPTLLCHAASSAAVSLGADGRLTYTADAFGNTVPDFSLAGYRHGGVPLPMAPVIETIEPIARSADDTARLQAALDRAAEAPARATDGVRGAVLLKRGSYRCNSTLRVAPGVTLRGEGQDANGTIITATRVPSRSQEKPILIQMAGPRANIATAPPQPILDEKVPLGAKRLRVAGAAARFAAGDPLLIERRPNDAWIHDLKMDQIANLGPGGQQWRPSGYVLRWQARVVAVAGDTLTLDAPIICALEQRYDRSTVAKVTSDPSGRAAAVENVRLVSVYRRGKENSDEAHAWNAITVQNLVDSWVRNVTALHFANACVSVGQSAARITVQDCAMLDPVSQITGGRRYSFSGSGQYVLFQRCYTRHGRHDFVTGHSDLGPTVFLDCLAEETHSDIGPHHRWSCGQLYDNVKGGQMNVQDRGRSGTGHGWAGNAQVFWNCEARSFVVQKPWIPGAQNWAIGCVGAKGKSALTGRPDGWWESPGRRVEPRSLYLAQLRERLLQAGVDAEAALRAVTTPEQRAGAMWPALRQRFAGDR